MSLDTPENSEGLAVLNHPSRVLRGLADSQSGDSIWEDQAMRVVRSDLKLEVYNKLKNVNNSVPFFFFFWCCVV